MIERSQQWSFRSASRQYTAQREVIHRLSFLIASLALTPLVAQTFPTHVPPKRSSQIQSGFGINSDLPRKPYLPWERWWWTRMFDAGVSWIRIGQYENSSDATSWNWVEQRRGVYAIAPEVDDYVDSLVDNHVTPQIQLMYGNAMYTSRSGVKPDRSAPEPGTFHNDDRGVNSAFWPPTKPDEIAAFIKYVKWMLGHFKGRIHYYALWNEDIRPIQTPSLFMAARRTPSANGRSGRSTPVIALRRSISSRIILIPGTGRT